MLEDFQTVNVMQQIKLSGLGAVAIISATAFIGAAVLSFLSPPKQQGDLAPPTLDSFGITLTEEGTAVPLLYGFNRIPGNVIFFGNLETKEIRQSSESGKGGGGENSTVVGYEVRIDIWQTIGLGELELIEMYVNDELQDPEANNIEFNNGVDLGFPNFGQDTENLEGISHIALTKLFLGENQTTLPVIHFVVRRILNTGLPNENMTNGSNPAAVVYDLFLQKGLEASQFNVDSFIQASNFFFNRGIAISLKIDSPQKIGDIIETIRNIVSFDVYIDNQDRVSIREFDPLRNADWTITNGDFKDLEIAIDTYSSLEGTEFVATYQDKDKKYTQRMVGTNNAAVEEILGETRVVTLDFSMIRDETTASNLVFETMRQKTFPKKRFSFTSNLKLIDGNPGDIINFSDNLTGFSQIFIRITSIQLPGINSNEIKVECEEIIERLYDFEFTNLNFGSPSGIGDQSPDVVIRDVFEFPYNEITKDSPAIIAILERLRGTENGYDIFYSPTREPIPPATEPTFDFRQNLGTFCQTGTLDADYNFTNYIDETGLIYTPVVSNNPEYDFIDLQRSLRDFSRFLLINDELMTFSEIFPEGIGSFRITGIQRGVFGSRIRSNYTSGVTIVLFDVLNNVLNFVPDNNSIIQSQGLFFRQREEAPFSEFETNQDRHSTMARIPGIIEVTKTGSSYAVKTWPHNRGKGFNVGTPFNTLPAFDSDRTMEQNSFYEVYFNNNRSINFSTENTVDFTVTAPDSSQNVMNIETKIENGTIIEESQIARVTVPSTDGVYKFYFRGTWSRKKYNGVGDWIKDFIEPEE